MGAGVARARHHFRGVPFLQDLLLVLEHHPVRHVAGDGHVSTYFAREDILTEPLPVQGGLVHLPDGSGLGITVDPDRLAKYSPGLLA